MCIRHKWFTRFKRQNNYTCISANKVGSGGKQLFLVLMRLSVRYTVELQNHACRNCHFLKWDCNLLLFRRAVKSSSAVLLQPTSSFLWGGFMPWLCWQELNAHALFAVASSQQNLWQPLPLISCSWGWVWCWKEENITSVISFPW